MSFRGLSAAALCMAFSVHAQPKLPDGPGKEQVTALCSGCHGIGRVMASGYPQAYWHTAVRMMVNFGVPIPPDQVSLVTDYLAKSFPEKPKPDANIVPGPVRVAIREWQLPTPGARPHDPLATRDGNPVIATSTINGVGLVEVK